MSESSDSGAKHPSEQARLLVSKHDVDYGSTDQNSGNGKLPVVDDIPSVPSQHAIGMLGSIAIAVNTLTGPAMVNLPATFQRSGLIPTTVVLLFVCVLSSLCSLHMADVVSKVPGNRSFVHEVEFSEAFQIFWGQSWFVVTQVIFFCCVTCLNISSIVDTAQVVDTFVGHWSPTGSAAILFHNGTTRFVQWDPIGYVAILVIFLPMALMDLKENAAWQVMGFLVLLFNSIQFSLEFFMHGMDRGNLSLWGESWGNLFGVILFNFALVVAIPAWLYEKKPSVDVPTVVYASSGLSAFLYILIGSLGALSISNVSDNMLESMMSGVFGTTMQLGASMFAFMIIGLGIPLFSVLTRMSLEGSGLCSHMVGNLLAVYFPFSISWALYQGECVTTLLSWGGVLFTSAVSFVLPLVLALHTLIEFDREGSIAVYGELFGTRHENIIALKVLLALASASVAAAILGVIFAGNP